MLMLRPDFTDVALENPEMLMYEGGSSSRVNDGSLFSGYAICTDSEVVESGKLPKTYST